MSQHDEDYQDVESPRAGSSEFYNMLREMADIHDKKSHDYASNSNPYGNYHFAGMVANLFKHSPEDAGFVGRIAEKIYRIANMESSEKTPRNESIEDTERDIATIVVLWMANRRERRRKKLVGQIKTKMTEGINQIHKDMISGVELDNRLEHVVIEAEKLDPIRLQVLSHKVKELIDKTP